MSITSSQRHAESRRRLEEERAERRRRQEEELARRTTKRASSKIPAKWALTGGAKINGTPVQRMIYIGCNMSSLPSPHIPEPSLINPVEPVAETSEGAEKLPEYPMYQLMSPAQRKGYIDFLASDRSSADDIGYVFLYLYGFERRLLVDSAKPGEVGEEEREVLVDELLRLHFCFAKRSQSLAHYICMLLLYDGSVFSRLDEKEISSLFALDAPAGRSVNKNRTLCDNADSMSYLLVSRLSSIRYHIPILDLVSAAKGRFLRSSNAAMLGITKEELYEESLDRLLQERMSFCDLSKLQKSGARPASPPSRPRYFPASPMIRKHKKLMLNAAIAPDPEDIGVPLKELSDLLYTCKRDLDDARSILQTSSLRDIGKVELDALSCVYAGAPSPLQDFLDGRHGATYVPISVLKRELSARFGAHLSYTSKGILSAQTQHLIAISAILQGWQAMVPDAVEGMVSSFWRIDESSRIVMFERGVAHKTANGKRCANPVFGGDESKYMLTIPGAWMKPAALSFIYAWFISKLEEKFDKSQLTSIPLKYYPAFSSKDGNKKNQIGFFFSLLHATYSLKLSTHGIKKCLEISDFSAVQECLFTLCDSTFGNLVPEDVLSVLEDIYKKCGKDPSLVLYDYHAGSYQAPSQEDTGFFIDEEKFAETLADTTNVQDILSDAMGAQDDAENPDVGDMRFEDGESDALDTESEDAGKSVAYASDNESDIAGGDTGDEDTTGESDIEEEHGAEEGVSALDDIRSAIEEFFGDSDEAKTSDLLALIVEHGGAATTAEAMGVIASINSDAREELIEIDGQDVYWNA